MELEDNLSMFKKRFAMIQKMQHLIFGLFLFFGVGWGKSVMFIWLFSPRVIGKY